MMKRMSRKNYRFLIEYDGTRYYGWQRQPDQETIQGKLEKVLALMTGDDTVEMIGAGRTDAGVHARGMVANAVFETNLSEEEIRDYFNRYLPDDIAVKQVKEAAPRFHARYNDHADRRMIFQPLVTFIGPHCDFLCLVLRSI